MNEEKSLPEMPPLMKVPGEAKFEKLEDAAYALFDRASRADEVVAKSERRLSAEMAETKRSAHRLIAALAAERFEFDRLLRRVKAEIERGDAIDLLLFLHHFARAWDMKLSRLGIQVIDLAGHPLSDDLVEDVEVESFVPDAAVDQTMVRETLLPLVLLGGKPIGPAKIITSVPVGKEEQA